MSSGEPTKEHGSAPGHVDVVPEAEERAATSTGRIDLTASVDSGHVLTSTKRGASSIEVLAKKVEDRRANRIPVTFDIRKLFLKTCLEAAKREKLVSKISIDGARRLRDLYKQKANDKDNAVTHNGFFRSVGYWDDDEALANLFTKGVESVEAVDGEWFYYRDFNFYGTVVGPKFQIFGNPFAFAIFCLLLFYFGSAILFCAIMDDESACARDGDNAYEGWLTAVYFASVTMSTVGYGDVNLSGGERWRTFIGWAYMLVALVVGATVFATFADAALSGVDITGSGFVTSALFRGWADNYNPETTPLYKQIRRITFLRVFELLLYFFFLNVVGMFIARAFIRATDVESQQWDYMTTFYWAIQTTTTIGYGDLDMPFQLRWFQIFFTTLGTAFVGSVFGGISSLNSDISELRNFYAWKRREVSRQMISDMQGDVDDGKVDQYEFMVGSLLTLNKISLADVEQIMDKYRELAGDKGFLMFSDVKEHAENSAVPVGDTVAEEEIMKL